MSPWSDRNSSSYTRFAELVLVPATATALLATALPASANDTAPVEDLRAPVLDIVAPVVDIAFGTADLKGAATVQESPASVRVRLSSEVLFDKDSARLRPAALSRLAEVAQELAAKGPGTVSVVGYTDDLGSTAHGLQLSRRRAEAVASALRPRLARPDYAFTVAGRGEADPAVPNTSEANRKLNRRVELTYRPR